MSTRPNPDEFEILENGIRHKPTGYTATCHAGSRLFAQEDDGRLGEKLPDGKDYGPHEVREMARQLWAEHVART